MSTMKLNKIGVIGAGQMGNGIAQVCAVAGYEVIMIDIIPEQLGKAKKSIEKSVTKLHEKGKLTQEQKQNALTKIKTGSDMKEVADCDLVIEAATENKKIKFEIFKSLDAICSENTILATNTSSISITELAAVTKRPENFIGMHFMNPVPLMKLVEVIRGLSSSDEVTSFTMDFVKQLGKVPVEANDYPAFIANRILCPMLNEAVTCVLEGVGDVEAIDTVMKLGMNHPMGPLFLADYVGLDTVLAVLEVLYEGFRDPKYRPSPLLKKLVAAGHYGVKSGRGFYDHTGEKPIARKFR